MKLSVLALDYDGTIASNDRVPPPVLDAIADARRRKVTVFLVTGRILDVLRRVAGDLDFVDGIVAENGAVHFAGSRHTTILAPQIQQGLHVYAHCLRGSRGGVALLAINNNRTAPSTIAVPTGGDRYTLAAGNLDSRQVQLNGTELALATNDELPTLSGSRCCAAT